MANIDRAYGLIPLRHRNGAPYNGAANPYVVDAGDGTALFIGDPVILTGTSNTSEVEAPGAGSFQPGTLPVVTIATAGASNFITGIVVAVAADPVALENVHRLASTERIVFVADDPDLLFSIQEDSVGGALAATSVGLNANLVAGAGSTVTNLSGWELDSSGAATTNNLQLRIERLLNQEDNEIGINARWEVAILQHSLRNLTGV